MNFRDLDELIHSGAKEIILNSDVVLSDGEKPDYVEGIKIDVDGLVINGNGHVIDASEKVRIFCCSASNVKIENITLKNGFAENSGGAIINSGILSIAEQDIVDAIKTVQINYPEIFA